MKAEGMWMMDRDDYVYRIKGFDFLDLTRENELKFFRIMEERMLTGKVITNYINNWFMGKTLPKEWRPQVKMLLQTHGSKNIVAWPMPVEGNECCEIDELPQMIQATHNWNQRKRDMKQLTMDQLREFKKEEHDKQGIELQRTSNKKSRIYDDGQEDDIFSSNTTTTTTTTTTTMPPPVITEEQDMIVE